MSVITSVTNKTHFLANEGRVPVPDGATWCSLSLLESAQTSFFLAFGVVCVEVGIIKDFKSFVFGSADSKAVMGAFYGSADYKGGYAILGSGRGCAGLRFAL